MQVTGKGAGSPDLTAPLNLSLGTTFYRRLHFYPDNGHKARKKTRGQAQAEVLQPEQGREDLCMCQLYSRDTISSPSYPRDLGNPYPHQADLDLID